MGVSLGYTCVAFHEWGLERAEVARGSWSKGWKCCAWMVGEVLPPDDEIDGWMDR